MLLSYFLRVSTFLVDNSIIEVVEILDLLRDSRIAADRTFELFSQSELQLHLAAIEIYDATALAVYTHLS